MSISNDSQRGVLVGMDCETIDQAQRTRLPSEVVQPGRTDAAPQQASTQPGDGGEVHTVTQPGAHVVEVPSDRSQKIPFKEQVLGVAKKTRGTLLGKPELKQKGEEILEGKTSAFADEPQNM